jgi:hypothetical protein
LRKSPSSPPTCEHGFKLVQFDLERGDGKARYCELCGLMNDMPAARSTHWGKRLAYENLAMTRGIAPSTDSPTSSLARKFSKAADKVWACGKNSVLVGGSAELEIVGGAWQTSRREGTRKRSAAGRDKVRPWQNPNVDVDETADAADSRLASHQEPGDRDFDQGVDTRVAKRPGDLFDEQTLGCDPDDPDEKTVLRHESDEKPTGEGAAETIAEYNDANPEGEA